MAVVEAEFSELVEVRGVQFAHAVGVVGVLETWVTNGDDGHVPRAVTVARIVAFGHWTNRERERNVLFNDALNTFYLRLYGVRHMVKDHSEREREMFYLTTHSTHFIYGLYGVRHMVKDHSDSERGNPLLPHRLLFPINSKGSFICTIPQTG